jgi:Ca2+-binding RTX toxin-like protein
MDHVKTRPARGLAVVLALVGAVLVAIPGIAVPMAEGPDFDALRSIDDTDGPAPGRSSDVALASGELRAVVSAFEAGIDRADVAADGSIVVEVLSPSGAEARRAVLAAGGEVLGEVEGWLLLARLPVASLEGLEATDSVRHLRTPRKADIELVDPARQVRAALATLDPGEHIAKMKADAWHAAGYTGQGLKIGIIDAFTDSSWDLAELNGQLPPAAGTFCIFFGSPCNLWAGGSDHGVGVAEIIHELVPDAELYLADVFTATDIQAAVDWFDANGVVIINRSQGAFYDGPGDGTGPLDAVADDAVAKGMTFLNAAGNFSGVVGGPPGDYWRGGWVDDDDDGWLEFAPGDELNGFICGFIHGLRWDDWAGNRSDYDLFIFDEPSDFPNSPIGVSVDDQTAGADPIEWADCGAAGDVDYLAVKKFADGNGTGNDTLEFAVNLSGFEHWNNPYSANGPISDSSNPGVISVGAIDPAAGFALADYSSWGPTNDERLKPDLTAASCMNGYVFGFLIPVCFNGTSAASPAAAGAAALVLDAELAATPGQLTSWLYANAMKDRGPNGDDNRYGRGELILPPPPVVVANDNMADAIEFATFPYSHAVTTDQATEEMDEQLDPAVCGLGTDFGNTVWYRYSPVIDHTLEVDTFGSDFDTVLVAYTSSGGTETPIDCDNDTGGSQSSLSLSVTKGTDYLFQVAGFAGAGGDLVFNATAPGPLCFGLPGTHVGTANADVLNGTSGMDVLIGRGGNDTINGAGGPDLICGNDGGDVINGQGGNDTISGGGGGDTISGGNGNDTISGDNGADDLSGDAGNDVIDGRRAQDVIDGGDGADILNGNDNPDIITGGDGDDTITGGPGADDLRGDGDDDTIEGNRAPDLIRGGTGNDTLDGGDGLDTVRGDGGNDTLLGGFGADTIIGGNGKDTVSFAKSRNPVVVDLTAGTASGDGADTLSQIEHVTGSKYDDTIDGDASANTLDGADGRDTVSGAGGDDVVRGGNGDDTLRGNGGNDTIKGQAGNDLLNGGSGTDTLNGGSGSDTCTFGETITNC